MNIIVCIKQVPDTNDIKIDPVTNTLIREGVESILNPFDTYAVEEAIRLKESYGGKITAITMGPPQADNVLKEAISLGVDEIVLLSDRKFAGADTWATSNTLAAAIRKIGDFDLILFGQQAIDGDTAQVGPQIAEHLAIPHVSYVSEVKTQANNLIVKREFEDFYQRIKVATPCLITSLSSMNKPRYMRVGRIFDAYRDLEIKEMGQVDIDVEPEELGLKGSPTKVRKTETKKAKKAGEIVELDPQESAEKIISLLAEKYII